MLWSRTHSDGRRERWFPLHFPSPVAPARPAPPSGGAFLAKNSDSSNSVCCGLWISVSCNNGAFRELQLAGESLFRPKVLEARAPASIKSVLLASLCIALHLLASFVERRLHRVCPLEGRPLMANVLGIMAIVTLAIYVLVGRFDWFVTVVIAGGAGSVWSLVVQVLGGSRRPHDRRKVEH